MNQAPRMPARLGRLAIASGSLIVVSLIVYLPLLNGWWLGDDFSNLYRAWSLDQDGRLLEGTLAFFGRQVDAVGAFYRPVMMASLSLSYALFGLDYAGWAATSLLVHLASAGLVYAAIRRLAPEAGPLGGLLGAGLFALNPLSVEAVAWVSARADGWITLLTLAAFLLWADAEPGRRPWRAACVPVLLLIALGFKESAVVFPLQLLVFALLWPGPVGRPRWIALAVSGLLAAGFMGLRLGVTGSALEAYRGSMSAPIDPGSLVVWWSALFEGRHGLAALFTLPLVGLGLMTLGRGWHERRMAGAALLAAGGLLAATLINLRDFAPSGEGGRLLHTALAWWCIGVGLVVATLRRGRWPARLACTTAAVALLVSIPLTVQLVGQFRSAQDGLRAFAAAVPSIAESRPGLTLVLVPDRIGPVVAARNGSGALVMPPLQPTPLLHRVLPTLDAQTARRHRELRGGLATRLAMTPPADVSMDTIVGLLAPADARAPDWIGCWDPQSGEARVEPWPTTPWLDDAAWRELVTAAAAPCGLQAGR